MYLESFSTDFDLKSFLEKKLYIGYARANLGDDASEDEITEFAIKTYQQNFRIEATGILDDETLSSMKTPRCVVVSGYYSTQNNYDWYRDVTHASYVIAETTNTLRLGTNISDGACKIYKMLEDCKCARGYNTMKFAVACIYIACRQQGKPLAMQEISSSIETSTAEYEFVRTKEYIVEHLKLEIDESVEEMMPAIPARAGELTNLVGRFCSNLGMSNQLKPVQESIEKAGDLDLRSKPLSVAAAIIYMVTQISKLNKSLRDISNATIVAEDSIKSAYKDLYPHAAKIIPKWYAKERDFKNLISPIQD